MARRVNDLCISINRLFIATTQPEINNLFMETANEQPPILTYDRFVELCEERLKLSSPTAIARRFKWSKEQLQNWKARGIPAKHYSKIAAGLDMTLDSLLARGNVAKPSIVPKDLSQEHIEIAVRYSRLDGNHQTMVRQLVESFKELEAYRSAELLSRGGKDEGGSLRKRRRPAREAAELDRGGD